MPRKLKEKPGTPHACRILVSCDFVVASRNAREGGKPIRTVRQFGSGILFDDFEPLGGMAFGAYQAVRDVSDTGTWELIW